ncbi:hypothetical protein [Halopiger aswanensis]|uniref:Uncharacterized protein n=1 Tax=Halopiger aswanensis TaxID=148449 RepID=A0A3R7DDE3_9EURY|nr:hypothetical protein [Halopiger aswanensis]RKD95413.1 hypothetical protein ATJ93_2267 [Halopiger aswanensis]
MTLAPDRRLQVRIAGALALVVLVNGLVLSALVWCGRRALSASGRSVPVELDVPLAVGTVLFGAVALVVLQARYGSRTIVGGLDPEELEDERPERDARLDASATLGIVPRRLPFDREDGADEDDEQHWFDRWFVDQFAVETVEEDSSSDEPGYVDRAGERVKTWLSDRIVDPVTTSVRRALAWRPATHPTTEARIERLRAVERRRRE